MQILGWPLSAKQILAGRRSLKSSHRPQEARIAHAGDTLSAQDATTVNILHDDRTFALLTRLGPLARTENSSTSSQKDRPPRYDKDWRKHSPAWVDGAKVTDYSCAVPTDPLTNEAQSEISLQKAAPL